MKASMSGQKITIYNKIISSWRILKGYQSGVFGDAIRDINFHNHLVEIAETYLICNLEDAKLLDLGCGQTATQVALFAADGVDIIGIDMEVATNQMTLKRFFKILKVNGLERAIKSFLRSFFFDKPYYKELNSLYSKNIQFDKLDIRLMNSANLTFTDNYFDFIFSTWVFEHIADVPAAIKEVNRVLKETGVAWIGIHLFPSLSGGHNLEWLNPEQTPSKRVKPWDHLLDNKFPANAFLNKLSLKHYQNIFNQYILVKDIKRTYEGEKILTPEIEQILSEKGYTKEDLITRTVFFLCNKKT